jgi:hypothetical protein
MGHVHGLSQALSPSARGRAFSLRQQVAVAKTDARAVAWFGSIKGRRIPSSFRSLAERAEWGGGFAELPGHRPAFGNYSRQVDDNMFVWTRQATNTLTATILLPSYSVSTRRAPS